MRNYQHYFNRNNSEEDWTTIAERKNISKLHGSTQFPHIPFKNFQQIFKTKSAKVSIDNKLKGRKKSSGKSFLFFLLIYDVVNFLICLLNLVVEQSESEKDSSEDDSWTAMEASGDDDEIVMKGFISIGSEETYAEVSNLSDNFGMRSVGNNKKYNIAKDQTFMVYDFIYNKKKYC